jgi:hypothetical protein
VTRITDLNDMDEERQRTVAVWAVFVLPFLCFGGWLAARGELTPAVVGIYWFPAVVLTVIGTIPPPWHAFGD